MLDDWMNVVVSCPEHEKADGATSLCCALWSIRNVRVPSHYSCMPHPEQRFAMQANPDTGSHWMECACREMLPKAKEQPPDSEQFGSLENTTLFGVAQYKRVPDSDNSRKAFSDQVRLMCRHDWSFMVQC